MHVSLFRFFRDTQANVAIIFALTSVLAIPLAGFGIDYGMAVDRKAKLDAFADAAALAAVTPTMMAESQANAVAAATNAFNVQAQALPGISYNPANLSVTVTTSGSKRTVTVSYQAASQN